MAEDRPRLFADDAAVRHVGEGLLARTLPKAEWTHEAHLASCLWLLVERPDVHPERDLRGIISGYNESVGGVNSDSEGYHETITQCFIAGVRTYLAEAGEGALGKRVNALLRSPMGQRDWPLRFYSRELLFSVAARLAYVEPDLAPLGRIDRDATVPTD